VDVQTHAVEGAIFSRPRTSLRSECGREKGLLNGRSSQLPPAEGESSN
jgi:hypothetical protein